MQAYDSLEYFDELKAAGVPENQARVQANALRILNELATKDDLEKVRNEIQEVRNELKGDIQDLRNEMKGDIQDLRVGIQEVRNEIQEVRNEIQEVRNELKGDIQDLRSELHITTRSIVKWTASLIIGLGGLMIALFAAGVAIFLK